MVARFLGELAKFRLTSFGSLFSLLKVRAGPGMWACLPQSQACCKCAAAGWGHQALMPSARHSYTRSLTLESGRAVHRHWPEMSGCSSLHREAEPRMYPVQYTIAVHASASA